MPSGDGERSSSNDPRSLRAEGQGDSAVASVVMRTAAVERERGGRVAGSRFREACSVLIWLYLAGLVAVAGAMRAFGDVWWPATLLLLGPRWVFAVPLPLIGLAAVPARAWWRLPVCVVLLLGPVLGFAVPWRGLFAGDGAGFGVLTCNVSGDQVDSDALLDVIAAESPSVAVFEECGRRTAYLDRLREAGWSVHREQGLACASVFPIEATDYRRFGKTQVARFVLKGPQGPIAVYVLYVRTLRKGITEVLSRETGVREEGIPVMAADLEQHVSDARQAAEWVAGFGDAAVVAGDFNMPSESPVFRRLWPEYSDAFTGSGFGLGHTRLVRERGLDYGTRIDHVLTGAEWGSRRCRVLGDVGSDHLPVMAELVRRGG